MTLPELLHLIREGGVIFNTAEIECGFLAEDAHFSQRSGFFGLLHFENLSTEAFDWKVAIR